MPLLDVLAGLLFVVSSGIFFNERFRKNIALVVSAGCIAVISTFFLVEQLAGYSSKPPPQQPQTNEATPGSSQQHDVVEVKKPAPLQDGQTFQDCANCPPMVVIPAGSAELTTKEYADDSFDEPASLRFIHRFALGQTEVTVEQWNAFTSDTGRSPTNAKCSWNDPGFSQTIKHPVVCAGWQDIQAYVHWLEKETGQPYRIPTEAEWQLVGLDHRSGKDIAAIQSGRGAWPAANRGTSRSFWSATSVEGPDQWAYTAPVGSFSANSYGVYDMEGNVWEFTDDCASTSDPCSSHVTRGGSYMGFYEVQERSWGDDEGSKVTGFRVARDL